MRGGNLKCLDRQAVDGEGLSRPVATLWQLRQFVPYQPGLKIGFSSNCTWTEQLTIRARKLDQDLVQLRGPNTHPGTAPSGLQISSVDVDLLPESREGDGSTGTSCRNVVGDDEALDGRAVVLSESPVWHSCT